jgi:anthranilate phosphoribosyltransferase
MTGKDSIRFYISRLGFYSLFVLLKNICNQKLNQNNMTFNQAYNFQQNILNNSFDSQELLGVFERHAQFGLKADEFNGYWQSSQDAQIAFDYSEPTMDIVGTGGDGFNTINVSTLACLVCAKAGIKIAKHGNRSSSGKCGSADVLELMGYDLNQNQDQLKKSLDDNNFAFLMAANYNPAFGYVKQIRKQYGFPTYFNLLGPLLNPTKPKHIIIGVSKKISDFLPNCFGLLSKQLQVQGADTSWLIQSHEGMDEISLSSPTDVYQTFGHNDPDLHSNSSIGIIPKLKDKLDFRPPNRNYRQTVINPQKYGITGIVNEIIVDSPDQAKEFFEAIIQGKGQPKHVQAVALNAAAGIKLAGLTTNYQEAVNIALKIINSGELKNFFEKLK